MAASWPGSGARCRCWSSGSRSGRAALGARGHPPWLPCGTPLPGTEGNGMTECMTASSKQREAGNATLVFFSILATTCDTIRHGCPPLVFGPQPPWVSRGLLLGALLRPSSSLHLYLLCTLLPTLPRQRVPHVWADQAPSKGELLPSVACVIMDGFRM